MYIPVTMEEAIEYGSGTSINHRTLNSRAFIHDEKSDVIVQIPFNPLFSKFKDYFNKYMCNIPLSEEEQKKYRFSPKRMSLDMYGIVDYWSLLLYINDAPSILDFEPERVNIIYNDKITQLINELLILNRK